MRLKLRGAAGWLSLLIIAFGLSACGGGSSGGSSGGSGGGGGGGGAGGPPPPPPPPPVTAPSGLSYAAQASYNVGVEIAPLDPTVTGTVTSYGVTPALPAGLALDTTTGRISGTPTAPAPATTYTVTANNSGGSTTFDMSFAVLAKPTERVTEDRPDEKEGHQVHVIYALPSDIAEDEQLDTNGTIEASLKVMNTWLAKQTGGKELRFDTYDGGKLDITFMKLTRTDAQMNVFRSSVRKELEQQLYLHGFDDVEKMYMVYYGGDGEDCGRGAWPPALQGNVAALYIGAASGCRNVPFASGDQPPAFLEFLALHEALHVLGFVPACAPHYERTGHVNDSVNDVMYSASSTGTVLGDPTTLDVNLDDYLGRSVPGCLDLSNSAFLEPLPAGAEPPPGWPYGELTDLGCAAPINPGALGVDTGVMIVNKYLFNGTESTAGLFEVVPNPAAPGTFMREFRKTIPYNDGIMLPDHEVLRVQEGAVFVVLVNGNCLRQIRLTADHSRFTIE